MRRTNFKADTTPISGIKSTQYDAERDVTVKKICWDNVQISWEVRKVTPNPDKKSQFAPAHHSRASDEELLTPVAINRGFQLTTNETLSPSTPETAPVEDSQSLPPACQVFDTNGILHSLIEDEVLNLPQEVINEGVNVRFDEMEARIFELSMPSTNDFSVVAPFDELHGWQDYNLQHRDVKLGQFYPLFGYWHNRLSEDDGLGQGVERDFTPLTGLDKMPEYADHFKERTYHLPGWDNPIATHQRKKYLADTARWWDERVASYYFDSPTSHRIISSVSTDGLCPLVQSLDEFTCPFRFTLMQAGINCNHDMYPSQCDHVKAFEYHLAGVSVRGMVCTIHQDVIFRILSYPTRPVNRRSGMCPEPLDTDDQFTLAVTHNTPFNYPEYFRKVFYALEGLLNGEFGILIHNFVAMIPDWRKLREETCKSSPQYYHVDPEQPFWRQMMDEIFFTAPPLRFEDQGCCDLKKKKTTF